MKSKLVVSNESNLAKIIAKDPITSDDLAFLQYTSGSTGDPKGVMVKFGALSSNVQGIINSVQGALKTTEDIIGLSWLPQYHDMGLIVAIIAPFAGGWNCNMISPVDFIKDPLLWIKLMSQLHPNWGIASDFSYRLAARKFIEAKSHNNFPIPNLDLSSVAILISAAEPIQLDTKRKFEDAFGSYGLCDNWFSGGYGLAESVVHVTSLPEYKLSNFQPSIGQSTVAVGHKESFPRGLKVKIVNPNEDNIELREREVGELWLSGPSITTGYFGKPELTEATFHAKLEGHKDNFLCTGDLGFFEDDYLYICGGQKDLIIVNGVNHYPQDIENLVQNASDAVRPGCIAAFPSNKIGADGDLEIVFEVRQHFAREVEVIVEAVRMKIIAEIGIVPTRVVAIKKRTILKTTSGKIQRKVNRKLLHENSQQVLYEYDATSRQNQEVLAKFVLDNENFPTIDPFDQIMMSFFGSDFDSKNTWDDLGLSSMMSVSLRDAISDSFAVALSPDCFDVYITPDTLKMHLLGNQGATLEVRLPLLKSLDQKELHWSIVGGIQAIGSIVLLFLFAVSIVPVWYVGKTQANV